MSKLIFPLYKEPSDPPPSSSKDVSPKPELSPMKQSFQITFGLILIMLGILILGMLTRAAIWIWSGVF